jgi:t-SNARE complex subunit (syntaxin)
LKNPLEMGRYALDLDGMGCKINRETRPVVVVVVVVIVVVVVVAVVVVVVVVPPGLNRST